MFNTIEVGYIQKKGWRINADGLLVLTAAQFREEPYTGTRISDPSKRTLMIAGAMGCTLLTENKHFIVEG